MSQNLKPIPGELQFTSDTPLEDQIKAVTKAYQDGLLTEPMIVDSDGVSVYFEVGVEEDGYVIYKQVLVGYDGYEPTPRDLLGAFLDENDIPWDLP